MLRNYYDEMQPTIVSEVSAYVVFLLKDKLAETLTFHNISHTIDVVTGAREIGLHSGLSEGEQEIVEIAAWLHDTGYLYKYKQHEDESIRLARIFLASQHFPPHKTGQIIGCIEATRYPQKPKNLLEQVVCDADFYHFSLPNYPERAHKLKEEWCHYLGKDYSDAEWNTENCSILSAHKYFTTYGRQVLQKLKDKNLLALQSYCR